MRAMTDAPGLSERRPPARRRDTKVADFTMIVRVPGKPDAARVFTSGEADEAAQYAAANGGAVAPLPQ